MEDITIDEFKSGDWTNPSIGRFVFVSKIKYSTMRILNVTKKQQLLFVSHFSLGSAIITPLWSRKEICNKRPHKRNTLPLGTTKNMTLFL